jgi:hypothetical protein
MLAVIVTITLLVTLLESKLLELRGTMIMICSSFGIGTVSFSFAENIRLKNKENK